MVQKIAQFVYDATDCETQITQEEADLILQFIEKAGMHLVDDSGESVSYEPEEGWDAWIEAQDLKDQARDFQVVVEVNSFTGKCTTNRSKDIAQKFLEGKSFEELAHEYNVTRERIRQIVAKERRKYNEWLTSKESLNEKAQRTFGSLPDNSKTGRGR